ncbi:hypothetical protein SORBI_3008G054200 [Sorghum bicolor]|uniref:DUF6598 domain-containing protein n=1 Tax=Sorghum bicolor TaxID=4558 RepID=A0A1Z5R527_SORBI|nr:hypothetical protein SORBI_3008G054200 [Sorghum bicolor]
MDSSGLWTSMAMLPCAIPWTGSATTSSAATGTIARRSLHRRHPKLHPFHSHFIPIRPLAAHVRTLHIDSLLELTGPSRAVMLLDGPIFEIDLKVKGKGSSALSEDDKVLCLDYFGYNCIAYRGSSSYAKTKEVPSESCAMEFRFAHIINSVEATVTAHITNASCSFSARFSAHTTSIGEDVVLLDTRGQEVVPVKDDGEITLRRRVVVVEDHHQGQLILGLDAVLFGGDTGETTAVSQKLTYYPRSALRSVAYFDVGLVRIKMCVAWSLLP